MSISRGLEWTGTFFGIAGAVLIASRVEASSLGWILFAISSITLGLFAYRIQAWGLLLLQLCFCATNALGIWRWLIEPALG